MVLRLSQVLPKIFCPTSGSLEPETVGKCENPPVQQPDLFPDFRVAQGQTWQPYQVQARDRFPDSRVWAVVLSAVLGQGCLLNLWTSSWSNRAQHWSLIFSLLVANAEKYFFLITHCGVWRQQASYAISLPSTAHTPVRAKKEMKRLSHSSTSEGRGSRRQAKASS